jgi:hypothetical protein
MDQMLEMMQTLLSDTAELKERISSVEGALFERLQPSIPVRATGIAAQRGGRLTRSKRGAFAATRPPANHGAVPSLEDSDSDTSQPTTTDASTDTDHDPGSVDDDGVTFQVLDISPSEKRALQVSFPEILTTQLTHIVVICDQNIPPCMPCRWEALARSRCRPYERRHPGGLPNTSFQCPCDGPSQSRSRQCCRAQGPIRITSTFFTVA